jgi:hypothetical protein
MIPNQPNTQYYKHLDNRTFLFTLNDNSHTNENLKNEYKPIFDFITNENLFTNIPNSNDIELNDIDDIYKYWDKHNLYINSQIDEFDLEPDEICTYTIPISKKYKDHLLNSIVIDSKMELEEFTYYMGNHFPRGLESLYKQLTFMENLFFDKMNELVEMNRKLIDIKL